MIGFYFAATALSGFATYEVWCAPEYLNERYLYLMWLLYWAESLYYEIDDGDDK